jgi:FAD/FMN-containing dehydrogenase
LDHLIEFDQASGVLVAEAGVSFFQLLNVIVPRGWFVPVSPGTKFVTLGGAIANDVHGKNHHSAGTIGRHVLWFELLQSNGEVLHCSPVSNSEYFKATIGGLGLTGFITKAAIQLKSISGPYIDQEIIKFACIEEFFEISAASDTAWEYTVAWIDALASGRKLGRGLFIRGNHSSKQAASKAQPISGPMLRIPTHAPAWLLGPWSIKAFNSLYYAKQVSQKKSGQVTINPFFYPLDIVADWNKLYGKRGFFQFQCVVPRDPFGKNIREVLEIAAQSGRASFLAVLKEFGALPSPGMLSFPRKGVTLCLDFPNEGAATVSLVKRLEDRVIECGGALYPAKDAVMSPESFQQSFPRLQEFNRFRDIGISSEFFRRVTKT